MKKFLNSLLPILLIFNLLGSIRNGRYRIKVTLNGTELAFDVQPQLINDRTMVPMRKIFEALDANVEWQEETQTILATKDDTVITMQIGNNVITINGADFELDAPPQLVNDRTLVPVRAVAESFDSRALRNSNDYR